MSCWSLPFVSAAEQFTPGGVWAYLAQHPETKRVFDEAITGKAHGEAIIAEDSKPSWIKMLDIFMLALHTGRERTRHEFENMLAASGFRLDRVVGVGLGTSLLEAPLV